MKFKILFALLLVLSCLSFVSGQEKTYGRVYYSIKNGSEWGGLIKTNYTVTLTMIDASGVYMLSVFTNGVYEMGFNTRFQAMSSEGKAFHELLKGELWGTPVWKSPSGAAATINWIYFNKSVDQIGKADLKPFDLELQFADGSAIKYYISPAY